jgi:aminoglycoside phosphotransferase (APT) family kinase protein
MSAPRSIDAIMQVLRESGVPVAGEADRGARIGRDLLADPALPEFGPDLVRDIGAALGRVHGIAPQTARALSFLPVPLKEPVRAEIARYRKALDAAADPRPLLEYVLCWLDARAPQPSRVCLVHGAFHADRVLVQDRRMSGIADWDEAHWGDPREDLGAFIARFARGGNDDKVAGGLAKFAFLLEGYNSTAPAKVAAPEVQYWEIFAAASAAVRAVAHGGRYAKGEIDGVGAALAGLSVSELELDALLGIETFEKGKR